MVHAFHFIDLKGKIFSSKNPNTMFNDTNISTNSLLIFNTTGIANKQDFKIKIEGNIKQSLTCGIPILLYCVLYQIYHFPFGFVVGLDLKRPLSFYIFIFTAVLFFNIFCELSIAVF